MLGLTYMYMTRVAMCACMCSFAQSHPVNPKSGHFFLFWKATSHELLPRVMFMQRTTRNIILAYFRSDLVKVTSKGEEKMDAARIFYERMHLPSFPKNSVLKRENKKTFFFIKSLLKEVYRTSCTFQKVHEILFPCNDTLHLLCGKTMDISRQMKKLNTDLKKQLMDYFKLKELPAIQQTDKSLYRRIVNHFNKKRKSDEAHVQSDHDGVHGTATVDSGSKTTAAGYRHRDRATVAFLYAMFVHLQNTEASLRYALIALGPHS